MKYADYPIASFAFWIVGQTGNPQLIQAVNGFVEYTILTYIALDYCKSKKTSNGAVVACLLLMLALVPLYSSIAAIRSTPAFAIGMLALYRDVYKAKRDLLTLVLYLAPFFIHAAGLSLLAIRLLSLFNRKQPAFAFIAGLASLPVLIGSASALTWLFSSFGVNPLEMLIEYSESGATGWAATVSNSLFYQLFRYINICFIAVTVFDVLRFNKLSKARGLIGFELSGVLLSGLGLVLGFCLLIADPSFMRYSYAIYPFVALYIIWRQSNGVFIGRTISSNEIYTRFGHINSAWFNVMNSVYIIFAVIFFLCHFYLAYLGIDMVPFVITLFTGVFGSPWFIGLV